MSKPLASLILDSPTARRLAVTVDGVEVTYTLNVALYAGTSSPTTCTYSLVYKVMGPGTFEYVTGPTAIQ